MSEWAFFAFFSSRVRHHKFTIDMTFCWCLIFMSKTFVLSSFIRGKFGYVYVSICVEYIYTYIYIFHVKVTQTVPDISPLMAMHQDPLLVNVIYMSNVTPIPVPHKLKFKCQSSDWHTLIRVNVKTSKACRRRQMTNLRQTFNRPYFLANDL